MEKQVNSGKNERSATILGIIMMIQHRRSMAQWETVAPKRGCERFDANEKKLGREIRSCHRACFQRRNNCTSHVVHVCTVQGLVASSDLWVGIGTATKTNSTNGWPSGGLGNKTTACSKRVPSLFLCLGHSCRQCYTFTKTMSTTSGGLFTAK